MSLFGISINIILLIIIAYLVGARYPGAAKMVGVA